METPRTRLRRFTMDDLRHLVSLESDGEVMQWTRMGIALPVDQIEQRLRTLVEQQPQREPLGIWVAESRDTAEFVGWFGLLTGRFDVPEIGFMLPRTRWGQGFATEVASRLVRFVFDENLAAGVVATTRPDNAASIRVLQKLGFAFDRTFTDDHQGHERAVSLYRVSRPV
jgi:RimJ/RimL family protein N-acetyltransferase